MHWLDKIIALIGDHPKESIDKQLELKKVIEQAASDKLISSTGSNMMQGVLRLEKINVSEVMIHRTDVDTINYKDSLMQIISKAVSTGRSRLPVMKSAGDTDSIMGILMIKDLLPLMMKSQSKDLFHIKNYLRKPLLVPESKKLSELLFDFQQVHTHIAIVIDQYGLISGIVTIDNITEQIIGEIDDEHIKRKKPKITRKKEGRFIVRASINLNKFNSFFKTNFSSDGVETLAGYALMKIGHIPEKGNKFSTNDFIFEIKKATNRRIVSIEVSPIKGKRSCKNKGKLNGPLQK